MPSSRSVKETQAEIAPSVHSTQMQMVTVGCACRSCKIVSITSASAGKLTNTEWFRATLVPNLCWMRRARRQNGDADSTLRSGFNSISSERARSSAFVDGSIDIRRMSNSVAWK